MRIPLLIALAVAILGIVFGSFFDLSISKAVASSNNMFAITISAIGPTIGFVAIVAMGGGFVALALKAILISLYRFAFMYSLQVA